jgi:hypothetical protein
MKPDTERADSSWMRITGLVAFVGILGLAAVGCGGNEQAGVTIDPCNGCWDYPPPPVVTLTASPTSVAYGASSTLTWSSRDVTSCTASGAWSGVQATAGSISTGALTASSTYTITCSGAGGTATKSVTVLVGSPPAPIVVISANPTVVDAGASSTLTWSSRDATSCTASGAWSGTQATAGSASTGALNFDSTFTLTCTGAGGSTSASVTVTTGTIDPCLGCWDY